MSRTEEFGAESRGQTFLYLPEKLTIVTDKEHPLYDPTAEDPPPNWLVDSIRAEGFTSTINVRKNGMHRGKPIIEVIAGRNRVKATQIVNKERKAAGQEPVRVEAKYGRLDDKQAMTLMIIENELRKVEDHVTRAKKLARWLDLNNGDEKRARRVWGLKSSELKTLLTVLDMDPEVQRALKAKRITLGIAKRLSDLPRDKQRTALAEILADTPKARGKAANDAVDEKTKGASRPRVRPFKHVERALDTASCMPTTDYQTGVLHALEWMMGKREAAWAAPADSPKKAKKS